MDNITEGWFYKLLAALAMALIGPWQVSYTALVILMMLDLILGVVRAWSERRLSPEIARRKTVLKLVTYWGLLIAAYQLQRISETSETLLKALSNYTVDVTVAYLAVTEFVSVLRHVSAMTGGRVNPARFGERIKELRDLGEHTGQKDDP